MVKKSQRVNSSNNIKCEDIIDQINNLIKKIRRGTASAMDITSCKKLTDYLQQFINNFSDIDEFDKWVAKEIIEMSRYTCEKYDRSLSSDKI